MPWRAPIASRLRTGEARRLCPGCRGRWRAARQGGEAPGGVIAEKRLEQAPVERVPRALAAEVADDRRAGEVEVAERVEHLVTHELVDVAQALAVQHLIAADHHGIVERAAARQPGGAHLIDLMQEAEGARPADVALEALGIDGDGDVLAADGAAGEVDGEA